MVKSCLALRDFNEYIPSLSPSVLERKKTGADLLRQSKYKLNPEEHSEEKGNQ